MRKVAVTGSLAAGKSTVCALLRQLAGAFVIDADQIVHQLLSPETAVGKLILQTFGSQVLVDGQLDRQEIARQAFREKDKLHILEQTLHPLVAKEIDRQFFQANQTGIYPFFVAEVPLLFESKTPCTFDYTVAVIADPSVCQHRFLSQGKGPAEQFAHRHSRQLPPEKKSSLATYTIVNNGSLDDLHAQVASLIPLLRD